MAGIILFLPDEASYPEQITTGELARLTVSRYRATGIAWHADELIAANVAGNRQIRDLIAITETHMLWLFEQRATDPHL
jgi:hypothetical protein